jgi:hypothetical protein
MVEAGTVSGPSEKAMEAAVECSRPGTPRGDVISTVLGAHDPALGLDRSVCLRDVVEALLSKGRAGESALYSTYGIAGEFIEREFGLDG